MANSEKAPDTSGGDVQTSKPSPTKSTGKFKSYLMRKREGKKN